MKSRTLSVIGKAMCLLLTLAWAGCDAKSKDQPATGEDGRVPVPTAQTPSVPTSPAANPGAQPATGPETTPAEPTKEVTPPVCDCGSGNVCCDCQPCAADLSCWYGQCVDNKSCCADKPKGNMHVRGLVVDFINRNTPPQGVQIHAVGAMEALIMPPGFPRSSVTSSPRGTFETGCFDVRDITPALVMLADDPGAAGQIGDGQAGAWYPTFSGVASFNTDADRTCANDARIYAVPNSYVEALEKATKSVLTRAGGLGLIFVVDAARNPVGGAQIKNSDGTPLSVGNEIPVFYPSKDGKLTGRATDPDLGLAIIAGPVGLVEFQAFAPGHTWKAELLGIPEGYCFTRPAVAAP